MADRDHDRGIRNEERLRTNDVKWVAHATIHDLEGQALRLQHVETMRRLDELNHEHARNVERNANFVSLDQYVSDKRASDARLKIQEDWRNKAMGGAVILVLLAGTVGAAIAKAFG